ncbi:MAG: MarR family transcriptional regulator [Acidimicrobiales bacterium]
MTRPDPATLTAWRSLLEAHRGATTALDEELRAAHDLPLEWYDVLFQLHEHGGRLRMGDLADRLLVSRSNCTRLVDRMDRAGLVAREDDPGDRRGRLAVLTPAGRRRFRRAAPTHLAGIARHIGAPLAAIGTAPDILGRALGAIAAAAATRDD